VKSHPPFLLRAATRADFRAIRKLVLQARINPSGLKWERFAVAVTPEGKVIGCGQVKHHRDGSKELASLVVSLEWRGRGIARAIVEKLIVSYPGEIHLMCRSGLDPFYRKFDFRPLTEDEMPPYFRRVKRLSELGKFLMPEGEFLLVMKRDPSGYAN